jgi:putative glycosyltransferase (TIGR04348 family)
MDKPQIVLVTPALAAANNGNWQTAQRWARFLAADYSVRLAPTWPGEKGASITEIAAGLKGAGAAARKASSADAFADAAMMIALHARRSAPSIAGWRAAHPKRPLVVVLTGTDLYRDIETDAQAQASLQMADCLIVLNELGAQRLPVALRRKTRIVLQSTSTRERQPHTGRHLRALMVGHLRDEKAPETYFEAARLLAGREDILLDHIGAPLDAALGEQAQALMRTQPRYRWLGALPHAATRARIQAAHLLVHCSRMEGGAHVVIEAVASGTPVLASRIDGNLGLLGADYTAVFDVGDSAKLAALLQQARDDPAMLPALQAQCDARAPLFYPERERQSLLEILAPLHAAR